MVCDWKFEGNIVFCSNWLSFWVKCWWYLVKRLVENWLIEIVMISWGGVGVVVSGGVGFCVIMGVVVSEVRMVRDVMKWCMWFFW